MASRDPPKYSEIRERVLKFFSLFCNSLPFSLVNPLLKQGAANKLDEYSATTVSHLTETVNNLQTEFDQIYSKLRKAIHRLMIEQDFLKFTSLGLGQVRKNTKNESTLKAWTMEVPLQFKFSQAHLNSRGTSIVRAFKVF